MKIRSNYVSNSSSSSFIVEFKDRKQVIRIAGEEISVQDFFDAFNSVHNFETEIREITDDNEDKENLIKSIDGFIEWSEDEEKCKLIELKKDIQSSDNLFARFDISYHDKVMNFLFRLLCKYEMFNLRYGTEG